MDLVGLLPFLLILVFFWVLIIRPARSRQRAQRNLQTSLSPGQKVMLTSGLYGTVAAVEDDAVVLETSPGVTMRWAKPAVARVLPDDDTLPEEDPQEPQPGRADGDTEPSA